MRADLKRTVEALLFAAPGPLSVNRMQAIVPGGDRRSLRAAIDELRQDYDAGGHAFQLQEIGGGWRILTRPDYTRRIEEMLKGQRRARLSKAALECLAVVAYRQPCTRPEVEDVRGVNCGGSLATLVDRGLVRITGRAESLGRPLLYGTTEIFLSFLGINSLEDLPRIAEIEALLLSPEGEEAESHIAAEERRQRLMESMEDIADTIAAAEAQEQDQEQAQEDEAPAGNGGPPSSGRTDDEDEEAHRRVLEAGLVEERNALRASAALDSALAALAGETVEAVEDESASDPDD
jgi:segregation and condensation protein B